MPTNVGYEYQEAEKKYLEADTDAERLKALKGMLVAIPKHKGTEKMQANIKTRMV